jgi:hypothetical protein
LLHAPGRIIEPVGSVKMFLTRDGYLHG